MAKLGRGSRNAVKKAGLVMAFIGVGLAGSECITASFEGFILAASTSSAEER